jgi:hypothetical protein
MKHLIISALWMLSWPMLAQNGYEVTFGERAYTPLAAGDTVVANRWDDPEQSVTIPFDIYLFNTTQPNTYVADIALILENDAEDTLSAIIPFGADLVSSELDSTSSPIIMKVEGNEGDRTLTLEWRNAHFYYLEGFFDYVNFQFTYYEASRAIEMSYGPSETDLVVVAYEEEGEVFGGAIGIGLGDNDDVSLGVFLEGPANNPAINTNNVFEEVVGFPQEDALFRFAPIQVSTEDQASENDCFNFLHYTQLARIDILGSHADIFLIDLQGRILKKIDKNHSSLDLGDLPDGVYFLKDTSCGNSAKIRHKQ